MLKPFGLILITTGILACGESPTTVGETSLFVEGNEEVIDLKLPDAPSINEVCDYLFQTGDIDCDFNPLELQEQCQNDYLNCPLYLTDREFPEGLGFIENLPELEGEVFTYGLPEAALRVGIQSQMVRGKPKFSTELAVATSPLATVEIMEFRVGRRQGQTAALDQDEAIILHGPTVRQEQCYEIFFVYTDPSGSGNYRITNCEENLA